MKWAFGRRFLRFGISSIRFAAVPVLSKIQFEDAKREIYYSSCGIQGYRPYMEDYTTVKLDFCDSPGYHFFAVLDGHVDYRVAEYCSKNLPQFLETKLGALIKSDASAEKISSAIEHAYLEFDQKIRASGLRSGKYLFLCFADSE
ncbi:unnamed protein product [Oikopleura dioica]|uniref:PPM-type phosphatase domain-containing protein n=1 Tax=Oikopleura dioica TaxID=34765 RepID=E4X3Y3_OIKDI|nr:unnamed protein product [Oikopleura dioica]